MVESSELFPSEGLWNRTKAAGVDTNPWPAPKEIAMDVIPHHRPAHDNLPPLDMADELSRALGEAVVRIWSRLPQDAQHHLFEQVVTAQGEELRPRLAIFLHDHHPRTTDCIKARAMLEPDSLGG